MNLEEGGYHILVVASPEESVTVNFHGLYDLVVTVREAEAASGLPFDTCSFTSRAEMMPRWMDILQEAKRTARKHGGKILYI